MKNRKNTDVKCKFNKNLYNNMNNTGDYNYQHCYNFNNYLSKQEFMERGVTIMSLVITIIVLLILAGITIKLALDDNGIIKQSKLASEEYQNKALQEQFALNQISKEIENASNNVGSGNQSSSGGSTSGGTTSGSSENVDKLKKQIDELQAQIAALEANQATGNATASQVLAGATFSTSEGVGLTGTMVNHSAITTAISVGTDENKVYLRTSPGAYLTNSTSGYPEICANISDINNATGYKYTKEQYDANYNAGVSAADNRVNTSSASYTNGYNAGYSASTYTIISNRTDRGQLSYTLTKNYKSLFIAANLGYDGTCTYRGGGNIVSIGHVANGARGDSGGPAGGHWCILAIGNATAGSTIAITGNYNHFVAAT